MNALVISALLLVTGASGASDLKVRLLEAEGETVTIRITYNVETTDSRPTQIPVIVTGESEEGRVIVLYLFKEITVPRMVRTILYDKVISVEKWFEIKTWNLEGGK